jgi:uncharacterized membrane protein YagU involved in acid resistance
MQAQAISQLTVAKAAIAAGAVAGVIDIGAASLINHASPTLILQAIASGLLGLSAYKSTWTVALGGILQLLMSIAIAAIYAEAATAMPMLRDRPYRCGLAYGVGVFLVMNLIVVPLSGFAPRPSHVALTWVALNLIAMLFFGVVVSLLVSRFLED